MSSNRSLAAAWIRRIRDEFSLLRELWEGKTFGDLEGVLGRWGPIVFELLALVRRKEVVLPTLVKAEPIHLVRGQPIEKHFDLFLDRRSRNHPEKIRQCRDREFRGFDDVIGEESPKIENV